MKQFRIYLFFYSIILFLFINSHSLSALECDAPCHPVISELYRTENCCAVKQYSGTNPSNGELISIIEQAANNQLADRGPHLPQMGSGCPENIRSRYNPSCPTFNKNHPPFVPPYLLQIIGYQESNLKQFYSDQDDNKWKTVVAEKERDCGYGMMQITFGMACGHKEPNDFDREKVSYDWIYNIGTGALFLINMWKAMPYYIGENDPKALEDWYYAIWAYNSGPKDLKASGKNNPNNPVYAGRPPADSEDFDPKNNNYPYQEYIWGYANNPPRKDGKLLWEKVHLILPDPKLFKDSILEWIPRPTANEQKPDSSPPAAPTGLRITVYLTFFML